MRKPEGGHVVSGRRRLWRILLLLAGLGLAAGLAALGFLLWRRSVPVTLPAPGGPYPVGRLEYDWTDPGRADPLGRAPHPPRKLNVWIWYPAERPASLPAPYLPADWIAARRRVSGVGAVMTQNLARVHAHSTAGPPLAAGRTAYPVLIVQPGIGPILPDYTTLCEDLASAGYVVVGSTPTRSANVVVFHDGETVYATPQGNPPDSLSAAAAQQVLGALIQVWAADDRFLLDRVEQLNAADPDGRFTGRLDLGAVGVLGHSFGGAAAAEFCSHDPRCKAGADLDGYLYGDVVQAGLRQPFLFLWSEPDDPHDPDWQRAMRDAGQVFRQLPPGSLQVAIRGMRHFNFADSAVEFQPVLRLLGYLGPIDGVRGLQIAATYTRAFFNASLLRQPEPVLDANPAPFPEVQVERR